MREQPRCSDLRRPHSQPHVRPKARARPHSPHSAQHIVTCRNGEERCRATAVPKNPRVKPADFYSLIPPVGTGVSSARVSSSGLGAELFKRVSGLNGVTLAHRARRAG